MIDFTIELLTGMWQVIGRMAPFLLFGFLMAGILSQFISPAWVARQLGKNRFASVVKAAMLGVPIPICSCGVIPLAATLRRQGASKGATTSFLIATPTTGVDSVSVNYALLGPVFAITTPLSALIGGLLGGALVDATRPRSERNDDTAAAPPAARAEGSCCASEAAPAASSCCASETPKPETPKPAAPASCCVSEAPKAEAPASCCASNAAPAAAACCADTSPPAQGTTFSSRITGALAYGFVTMPRDLAKPVLIGLIAAALVGVLVPDDFFANVLGSGVGAMLLVMAAAFPLYACSTGSIPLVAMLIAKGMAPGVGLVFLLVAPVANAATVTTMWKTLGARCVAVYVATIGTVAIIAGHVVNAVAEVAPITSHLHHHDEAIAWYGHLAGVILFGIIAYALYAQLAGRWQTRTGAPTGDAAEA